MREKVTELLTPLLSGSRMSPEQFLWTALVIGLILASIHLITMLVTRWGNRGITTKSLIFSIIVHLSCVFGLVAVEAPANVVPAGGREEEPETVIRLRQVAADSADSEEAEQNSPDSTPVWEKLLEPEPAEIARMDSLPAPELASIENSRSPAEPESPPPIEVPPPTSLPESAVPEPKQEETVEAAQPPVQAAATPSLDEQTADARPDVETPTPSLERQTPPADNRKVDIDVARAAQRGAAERVAPEPEPVKQPTTIEAVTRPAAELKRGTDTDMLTRRGSPAPSSLPIPETGTAPITEEASPPAEPDVSPLLTRVRPATSPTPEKTTIERVRPELDVPSGYESGEPPEVRDLTAGELARIGPAPDAARPEFEAVRTRKNSGVPSTYRLRNLARRPQIAREFGGTDESERAVEASLKWLAQQQHPDGYWDADKFGAGQVKIDEAGVNRDYAGRDADSGVTALAVLAFLGAGYTHEEGQYADQVDRALKWLVRQQRADGHLGHRAGHFAAMYCHGMATYAIAEAYAMQSDPTTDTRLREPLAKAVGYILQNQNAKDGGWRYVRGQQGDMSMFGWQLMALKSAEIAGMRIPVDARSKLIGFLRERSMGDHQGLAGYRDGLPPTPAMTAEALFCKQMLGIKRSNAASVEAAQYLLARLPKQSEWNEYYWYYGTLAMYQYGGKEWRTWNEALRDQLIAAQRTDGDLAGSWDPQGTWGRYGGRIYTTALSTLCLEVYYRFLPLYQMGGRYDAP